MRTLLAAAAALLLLLSPSARAQEQVIIEGPPIGPGGPAGGPFGGPGMFPRPAKTGTARIRGRVVSPDTGSGVRRAQVRLSGQEVGSRLAITDTEGRFTFDSLPAGRVMVSASKPGYVSVSYGQTRPFESGKAIELTEGQILDRADITMPRGSVITGRVVDEFGEPVADAMVNGLRSVWLNGRRRLQAIGRSAMTNDLGQYRLYGLSPGDYYVNASVRDAAAMELTMASLSGAASGAGPAMPGGQPSAGYAPTYFPGTGNAADAQKITVAAGQEAQGTDFALAPVRLARVAGTVLTSDGKPLEGSMINVVPRGDVGFMPMMGGNGRTSRTGGFVLAGLPPGDYQLQVIPMQVMTSGAGDNMMVTARIGGPNAADAESASVPVTVAGDDISNLVIVTSKGTTLSGQVIFEGGAKPPNGGALRLGAMPVGEISMMGGMGAAVVRPDGTFELRGLSGTRVIRAPGLPPGWLLKAVRVNGVDVTDAGMEFKSAEPITGAEVVFTSKTTDVSGTVTGSGGRPVKDYTVGVFSDDPQRWVYPSSRYVAIARPDDQGRFRIRTLPGGTYYAIASEYIAPSDWGDPELLERLKRSASTFTVDEGETKVLELKLAGG